MKRTVMMMAWGVTLAGLLAFPGWGQSGRSRPPAPVPPKPVPQPKTVPGMPGVVPEGGKLARQETSGITSRYQLRNGLTVLVRERHGAPLAAVTIVVKAGWSDDPKGMEGLARLTQEVILRGGGGISVEREVARLGGSIRGGVEADHSWLTIVAPAESYGGVVEMLAGLVLRPEMSEEAVKRAGRILAVKEAEERSLPESVSRRGLLATAFAGTALEAGGRVAEGMTERVTVGEVESFYRRQYDPGRSVIVVTGDIFSLPALGQVQLNFGGYSRSESGAGEVVGSPAAGLRYGNTRAGSGGSRVGIGYRIAASDLRERTTLEVMAAILGLGRGSRLWQGLREGMASRDRRSVAIETGVEYLPLPGNGLLVARMEVDPERIDRAEAEYFREIERFRRELVSEGEIERARVMIERRLCDQLSEVGGEGLALAREQLLAGDYRLIDTHLKRVRAVTAKDVQAAAAKYLTLATMAVHELEPAQAVARTFTPEKYGELVTTFAAGAGQPIRPEDVRPASVLKSFTQGAERGVVVEGQNVTVAPIPLPVRDFSVLRGPRAYVREDKSHPKVALTIVFQGGRLIEDKASSGTTELMLRSMLRSTTTRKGDLIALELESYGGDIRIISEPDFYGFSMEVLSRNAEPASKLLLEIIEKPFFDKEEVAREREVLLTEQRIAGGSAEEFSGELLRATLFPGHPYSLPRLGLAEVVKGLDEAKLEAWHEKTIRRQYPLVTLVGDTDGSALVSRIFSDGLKRGDLDRTLKVSLPTQFPAARDVVAGSPDPVTRQSIGFRVTNQSLTSPSDLQALSMIEQLLASGKGLDELREKEALAPAVRARMEQRLSAGLFEVSLTTPAGGETRALDILSREFQRLAGSEPTDEEFEFARNAAIGRYAIGLQSHVERSLEYCRATFYGRKPADVDGQPEAMVGVRKGDLKRLAESIFRNNQLGRGVVRGTTPPATATVKPAQ